jgi:hypothetical protein
VTLLHFAPAGFFQELLDFYFVDHLEGLDHGLDFGVECNDLLPKLQKGKILGNDVLVLPLEVVFLLEYLSDELVDVVLADFLLVVDEFFVEGGLGQLLVFAQTGHHRAEGVLLVVQVLTQVDHLVLELDHPFVVKLLVLQSHLSLHEEDGVDTLVVLVVGPEFLSE